MEIDANFWPSQQIVLKAGGGGGGGAFSSGILNKSIECVSPEIFPCDDLCGESASFTEQFNDVSPVLSVEVSWVVFGSVMIAATVVYCVSTLPKVLTDNLRYVVELVLPEILCQEE